MNVQLDLYDKLQSIRTKISDEEFNNLMDNFIDLYKKSNIKLLNEFYQSPTITNTINECKCSEYEICLDQDISKLKSCKNYQKFIYLYNTYNFKDKYSNFELHMLLAKACSNDKLLNLNNENKFYPSKFLVGEFNKLNKETKDKFMREKDYNGLITRAHKQSGKKLNMGDITK